MSRLHAQPFRTAEALPLVGRAALRGPRYRRVMHGVHQVAEDDLGHGRRIQGFRARHDGPFVLLGRSAAWAHGACWADQDDPVAVAIRAPHQLARTREVVPHLATLRPGDVVDKPLGPATSLGRTAVDLARGIGGPFRSLLDRVSDVDALVRSTRLTADQARAAASACSGLRGVRDARRVLSSCRDGVDSRPETRLRLLLLGAGLPEPRTQCPVRTAGGRVVARLDLGWPELRLGCEYDGAGHLDPRQVRADLRRHNGIREAGWLVLQVDRHQIGRPDEVLRQMAALLALRGHVRPPTPAHPSAPAPAVTTGIDGTLRG